MQLEIFLSTFGEYGLTVGAACPSPPSPGIDMSFRWLFVYRRGGKGSTKFVGVVPVSAGVSTISALWTERSVYMRDSLARLWCNSLYIPILSGDENRHQVLTPHASDYAQY